MKQTSTLTSNRLSKALVFATLCLFLQHRVDAQVCSNPNNIFGLNSSGQIYTINVSTAAEGAQINTASFSSGSASSSNALGFNSQNGAFYYFRINPTSSSQQFVSYNTTSNTDTILTSSPTSNSVHAGCVNNDGSGYYCLDVSGVLYYYSIYKKTWTKISSTLKTASGTNISNLISTSMSSGDIAVDGLGNLWILPSSKTNYGLYELAGPLPTTAQASLTLIQVLASTNTTPDGSAFEGIAFNSAGSIYMSTGNDNLYELINSTTLVKVGSFTVTGVGNDLTSCSFPYSTLPLSWTSFTTTLQDNTVAVDWSISMARDVQGFYVEKSTDGIIWQSIGYVGFSEGQQNYSATDANPAAGANYYRIREEDLNGSSNYSVTKEVTTATSVQIAVWPNPARSTVNVQNNGNDNNVKTEVYDEFGKRISSTILHSGNNSINISSFAAGTYILHMQSSDGHVYNSKIVKASN